MVEQEHLRRLEPYLGEDETTIDAYSTPTEIGLLTDRQLLTLKIRGEEERTMIVDSTYLDQLGGATLTHESAPDFHQDKLLYGIGSLFVAVVSLVLAAALEAGNLTGLLIVVGAGVGLIGFVLLLEAYNTPEDSVSISLQTSEGDVAKRVRLDEEYTEFVEAVSRTVSSAHTSKGAVTRTVGK